jgi:hypothetical protein
VGLFRPSRERRAGEDPYLLPKMMLFVAGAIFALIGMATEREWVLGVALLTLGFGMLLRILSRDRDAPSGDADPNDDDEDSRPEP